MSRFAFGDEFDAENESALYSMNAEKCVLGAVMLLGEAEYIRPILSSLSSGMFVRSAHRIIFSALESLMVRGNQVDIVTLGSLLSERDKLDDCGGDEYLFELAQFTPSAVGWEAWAWIVRQKAAKRALDSKWRKCLASLDMDIDELARMDAEPAHGVGSIKNPVSHIKTVELSQRSTESISTGFRAIDAQTGCGGWPKEQVSIVSATHKGGKTTLMLSSFTKMVQAGHCCLYASLGDMSESKLKSRMMRNITGNSRRPYDDPFEAEDFDDELEKLNGLRAYFYDSTTGKHGRDVQSLCRWIEAAHSQYRFEGIFIDYAQLIRCSARKNMTKTDEQDESCEIVAEMVSRLKVAGIVGSQITAVEGGESVTKYSRKWEEDAGLVLRITGDDEDSRTIEVARNRHGHQKQKFVMGWNVQRLRFEDRSL
jgi:replicative DNA helicase